MTVQNVMQASSSFYITFTNNWKNRWEPISIKKILKLVICNLSTNGKFITIHNAFFPHQVKPLLHTSILTLALQSLVNIGREL